jgi:hypothetical protein
MKGQRAKRPLVPRMFVEILKCRCCATRLLLAPHDGFLTNRQK